MAKLVFENANLKGVLKHTQENKVFIRSFGQQIQEYEKQTGKEYDFKQSLNDYQTFDVPSLWLVKDAGIYLMTAAKGVGVPDDGSHVCYAEGFNVNTDDDVYDKSVQAVGGDDFTEPIEFTVELQNAVVQGCDIIINLTQEQIRVSTRASKHSFVETRIGKAYAENGVIKSYANVTQAEKKVKELVELGFQCYRRAGHPFYILLKK